MDKDSQDTSEYWNHIIDPKNNYKVKLIELLRRYPIEYPGNEFIIRPDVALEIINELTELRIAVFGVVVWCYEADMNDRDCCPDGMGGHGIGENGIESAFLEYTHLGYEIPNFEQLPKTLDFATYCNPQVQQYIRRQLPLEQGYNDCFRVSIYLHTPLWNLFT